MQSVQVKRAGVLASSILAGLWAVNAAASDHGPSYTYIEGGYSQIEIDDFDADGDALSLAGSVALTDMFHLLGSYTDGEIEADFGFDIDVTTWELGGGMNFALSPTMDFVGQITWISQEFDAQGFGDVDDTGYGAGAGIRAMVTPRVELNGGISYADVADDAETTIGGKVLFHVNDMFALTGGISVGDDIMTYGVGMRAQLRSM